VGYAVKEIFRTLQGEGANAGRAAAFCRFSGCNLWSGREQDRSSAVCQFCDTNFRGTDGNRGGKFASASDLADAIADAWGPDPLHRFVVCTGGEPLLQLDSKLIHELHSRSFEIAIETNGTLVPPQGVDWVCVSPKARAPLRLREGNELKIVFPQDDLDPAEYENLAFEHFFLQPLDSPRTAPENLARTAAYCRTHPRWRLSLQIHKIIGFP
jgi:7-carboxy-7-deazaguanine synthase (Cx14CxxC type)